MHLCNIPQDKIPHIEIPTGLPLVYDSQQRKLRLLEDTVALTTPVANASVPEGNHGHNTGAATGTATTGGNGVAMSPLERYNFGKAPEYLFDLNHDFPKDDPRHWENILIRHPSSMRK